MLLTVIVTVYNEKDTIIEAIRQVKDINIDKQIIVVDNCSTDGTREILQKLNDPYLELVLQDKNYGYGFSVKTGARLAKGKYLFVQNSDLEYDPTCVYQMLELAQKENLDAVFGSRLLGKKVSLWRIIKKRPYYLATVITTFLINFWYGKKFSDVIGNRFYRTKIFEEINVKADYMAFDFELVSKLAKYKYKIKEISVNYKPRSYKQGKKIKWHDSFPAFLAMLRVKFFQ